MYTDVSKCVAAARRLLATVDARDVRYAALEARMGIEGLFYALLPYYREELPDDITKTWQPRQLIDAIIACNPFVEMHQQITIGPAGGLPGNPLFVGTYRPVTRKLLRQYYHRLGSYLHAAVDGEPLNEAKLRATVAGALDRVDENCRETNVIANVGPYVTVVCECGREIKCNIFSLSMKKHIQCPDPACAAVYDLVGMAPVMQTAWKLRAAVFACEECQHGTTLGVHRFRPGARIKCEKCAAEFVLRGVLVGERVDPQSHADSAANS